MHDSTRFSISLLLSMVCLCACKAGTQATTRPANQAQSASALTMVNGSKSGKIVYGTLPGATTQPAAMAALLRMVHNNCGDKPQVGRVFQFAGTNSVGVFFTVMDHPDGNIPLAGMVIAAATGPNQVQAAMIYDATTRFGTTVNPMLQQLNAIWHPGAAPGSPTGAAAASYSGSSGGQGSAQAAPLKKITLADNSAIVGVPAGWQIVSGSGGTVSLTGPHGEYSNLDLAVTALDTSNRMVQQLIRSGAENAYRGKWIFYPANVDLTKAFPDIYQQMRVIGGVTGSANLQIAEIQAIPGPEGER